MLGQVAGTGRRGQGVAMATLSTWRFPDADGAENAERVLMNLHSEGLIDIHDAAVVSWPLGKKKPKTKQLHNLPGAAALDGSFWGFLFGLIFFVPLLGLAVGAAAGAITGSLADAGIDDAFIAAVREQVGPGNSALFLLSENAVLDKVKDAFVGIHAELIQTNLTKEQEDALRKTFAEA
jgi:uncharacterized membrane protein